MAEIFTKILRNSEEINVLPCWLDLSQVYVPLHDGDFGLAFDGQVLLSAATTQQVVRVSATTLASEPPVHVGAVAAVTLPVGAAAAARVALLHVLIEVGHVGLAQLAHHHFIAIVCLTYVLRGVVQSQRNTHTWSQTRHTHETKMFRAAVKLPCNVMC